MSEDEAGSASWTCRVGPGLVKGYANGVVTTGKRALYVAGQVGWNEQHVFAQGDFAGQFAQALDNVLAVVRAAGGEPESVVKMTIYVTDLAAYR